MSSLVVLKQHRDALLLAEVAAWLHMFGKCHEGFLAGDHQLDIQIPPDLATTHPNLHRLLTDVWPGSIWSTLPILEFDAGTLSFFDLIKDHRNPNAASGLARLMWDAHGRGSGTEKGVLERFAPGQQVTVYPATALGREIAILDLNDLQARRRRLYDALEHWLQGLRNANAKVDWATFRRNFISRLERDFGSTVAETRRPMNDVTLFDQTAASVAMFKAALAQNLLGGWKEPVQTTPANKYKWRILRVGIAGPVFWGQAARLSDLLARKTLLASALDAVRTLLEETYPLGMEVYRDENGSLFIVADMAGLLEMTVDGSRLRDRLSEITAKALGEEASCNLELSQPTRNMLTLGQLATAMLPDPTPSPQWLQTVWKKNSQNDICSVCGLRPQGPSKKGADRKVCDVCEQRRADRSKQWAADLQSTIWTDEVADVNGRLALVVGSFGLDAWLRGSALSSMLMFDPIKRRLTDPGRNNKQYDFDYNQLLQDIGQAVHRNQFTGNTLLDNLVLPVARGGGFPQFYDLQVRDSDLDELGPHPKAELLALAMLRQNPSFARIRRVWETTRTFWQEVCPTDEDGDLANSLAGQQAGRAGPRLEIVPASRNGLDLGPFHTYELVLDGIRLSVVWDGDNKRFITCDNLDYLAKPEQLGRPVEQALSEAKEQLRPLTLEEPVGYGGKNKVWGTVVVEQVRPLPDTYTPAIPILAEPRTFMALLPADKALAVVQAIKEKYEREMGKVRNRLPLHLGVIFAHRRTPMRAILEAGRHMLEIQTHLEEQWHIQEIQDGFSSNPLPEGLQNDPHFARWRRIFLERDGHHVTWYVPLRMGDGETEDVWYPYAFVVNPAAKQPVEKRQRAIKSMRPKGEGGIAPCWLVHVDDLAEEDCIYFTPSAFDFEFLDTTARRFEIAYDDQGRRRNPRKRNRPYLLDDLERLEDLWAEMNHLEKSQRHQVIAAIEATREAWFGDDQEGRSLTDPVFRQFVHDTLAGAAWPKNYPWRAIPNHRREELVTAGARGELADLAELHLQILKE